MNIKKLGSTYMFKFTDGDIEYASTMDEGQYAAISEQAAANVIDGTATHFYRERARLVMEWSLKVRHLAHEEYDEFPCEPLENDTMHSGQFVKRIVIARRDAKKIYDKFKDVDAEIDLQIVVETHKGDKLNIYDTEIYIRHLNAPDEPRIRVGWFFRSITLAQSYLAFLTYELKALGIKVSELNNVRIENE